MSLKHVARRVMGQGIESVNKQVETDKYGFPLRIDTPHEQWKEVLETYIPLFDEVGWLSGFAGMKISDGCVIGNDNIGNYTNCTINIEHAPSEVLNFIPRNHTVEFSKRGVLIHEMIHHAHLHVNGYSPDTLELTGAEQELLNGFVSGYSSSNRLEAVAEVGTGIALGHDFPEEIHEIYEKYDGPKEVYEIREMC